MEANNFDRIFLALKKILEPYASKLVVVHDSPEYYYLDTKTIMPNKKPMFFGAVKKGKSYVSFYLMPLYSNPTLADGLSPELIKRKQGKSCFNFKASDEALFKELEKLTKSGFATFKAEKYV